MKLPRHKYGLYIEHNRHRDYYMTASAQLQEWGALDAMPVFESEYARQRCIAQNELWTMTWYPDTPIGSYYIAAPTLEELLAFAATTGAESPAREAV